MSAVASRSLVWGTGVAVVVLAVVVVSARTVHESSRSLTLGADAEHAGDVISAAYHYRHAAQWLSPFTQADDRALYRLVELGNQRADTGAIDEALFCWRSARWAVLSTRHLWTPHRGVLDDVHPRIATAMAEIRSEDPTRRRADAERYRSQLDGWRDRQASPWHAAGASLAFIAWLASLVVAGWCGLRADGRVRPAPLGLALAASVVFFASWWLLVRFA
jgi:hypothetical protein